MRSMACEIFRRVFLLYTEGMDLAHFHSSLNEALVCGGLKRSISAMYIARRAIRYLDRQYCLLDSKGHQPRKLIPRKFIPF